ncbi:beta-1,6-N-acetylglucosaminyltransferase [Falsiroseomonas selenitidurans]|uniref:Peptide O-xylosyltransferase n=1 Tax=Falsiroseomonas selenitidurans TaxID=2716335 RepID=A0ABX1E2R1_9PROT|nr:beta-1,6-N-acetylglucosaminyltransferase [Falsiroseomonas selenitidurans]NKC31376.1 beta-1,6-N-acetylglucosaminyltransferase [Falsiroseomonas selenitidurans]
MKRNAFLVLAHRAPALCRRLIGRLRPMGDVYLHVDQKVAAEPFAPPPEDVAEGLGEVFLANRRADIRWGSFAMVQATLDLLEDAQHAEPYARFTLLSGDSYPVQPDAAIHAMLSGDRDHISAADTSRDERRSRIERVYAPDTFIGQIKAPFHERHLRPEDWPALEQAMRLLPEREAFIRRTGYFIGSQWWSLTGRSVEAIRAYLHENPAFAMHFRYSSIPDEAFFQTAYMAAAPDATKRVNSPVHAKWDSIPRPFEYTHAEELPLLLGLKQPFARKFGDSSFPLLDLLDARAA